MKKIAALLLLSLLPALYAPAQTNIVKPATPETNNTPQWVRDLRRWEIILFGSFPFAMFTATFAMDMYRWNNANGLDFSDSGRRYAPWPLKSSGAIAMESKEMELTIVLAVAISAAVAVTDQVIVQVKRNKARKKAEALPSGSTTIIRKPWPEESQETEVQQEEQDETEDQES